MRLTVLGSGSTGNAVLICAGQTSVLVDAGLSAKETVRRLALVGVDAAQLDGVVITHEHSDHAGGLRVLLKSLGCPVYISGATRDAYIREKARTNDEPKRRAEALRDRAVEISSSHDFRIGEIDFHPFTVPHDAADNFGFVATRDGVRVATLMDFGCVTTLVSEHLKGCAAIVIESNHSRDMLKACDVYPWELKQRILSRTGHLSNEDVAVWLRDGFDGTASPHRARAPLAARQQPRPRQVHRRVGAARARRPLPAGHARHALELQGTNALDRALKKTAGSRQMAVGSKYKSRLPRAARRCLIFYCLLPAAICLLLSACAVDERRGVPAGAQATVERVTEDVAAGRDAKVYEEAAPEWRANVSAEESARTLQRVRERLGRVESRALHTGREQQSAPAPLSGHTLELVYQTRFERGSAMERFTLLERGGEWLLAGYTVTSDLLR